VHETITVWSWELMRKYQENKKLIKTNFSFISFLKYTQIWSLHTTQQKPLTLFERLQSSIIFNPFLMKHLAYFNL